MTYLDRSKVHGNKARTCNQVRRVGEREERRHDPKQGTLDLWLHPVECTSSFLPDHTLFGAVGARSKALFAELLAARRGCPDCQALQHQVYLEAQGWFCPAYSEAYITL